MRILFYLESPTLYEFFETLNDNFPLFSRPILLKNFLYLLILTNCNSKLSSKLSNFWGFFTKKAKTNQINKLIFLKILASALKNYASALKQLYNDENTNKSLNLLNNIAFHFLTPEVLTSVFLNNLFQMNKTVLLEEEDLLSQGLEFIYEAFGIIKDENLKEKIISFVTYLFKKDEFLKKLFSEKKNLKNVISRAFLEENHLIFLTFLKHFTENILNNDEVIYNFRILFFQEIKSHLACIQLYKPSEFMNKMMRFLCIFFQKLVIKQENIDCFDFNFFDKIL